MRLTLIYFKHETDKPQLLNVLQEYFNPFGAKTETQLGEYWENALNYFIKRQMLSQVEEGDQTLISDFGGENYIKNDDLYRYLDAAQVTISQEEYDQNLDIVYAKYIK